MAVGTPKWGAMWSNSTQVTSTAFSEVVEKDSTHPEKVSTRVRRDLCFLMRSI